VFSFSSPLQIKELKAYLYCTSLKDLRLDEAGRTNFTYKALGAGFWALKQKDFRQAVQDIVLEVGQFTPRIFSPFKWSETKTSYIAWKCLCLY